jgi:hypothetical protein
MCKCRLTLGEAIHLGRSLPNSDNTLDEPVVSALKGYGALPPDLSNCRSYQPGHHQTLMYPGDALRKIDPWLKDVILCPWCADKLTDIEIINHSQYMHVPNHEAGQAEVLEWLDDMEEDERRPLGVAIYFQTGEERAEVIWTARHQGLTLNAFLAAAVRLAIEHNLLLTEFARRDPPEAENKG